MKKTIFNFSLIISWFFILAENAHAYLDPGTGSYILQIIAGGMLAGLLTLKNYRTKILDLIKKLFRKRQ